MKKKRKGKGIPIPPEILVDTWDEPKPGDMIIPVASDKPDKRGKPDYERFTKFHLYQPKLPGVIPANKQDYFLCALFGYWTP